MITIVDYGMGNLGSIQNMLGRIGIPCLIAGDPETIARAEKLILPGVGAFDQAMNNIRAAGLEAVLRNKAIVEHTPLLGICLGMQILMDKSEEGPGSGLGLISGEVKRFRFSGEQQHLKVPHMGWNTVTPAGDHPLFAQYTDEIRFYFVHAYYVSPSDNADVIGSTPYGSEFCSAVAHGNIMGVQFHPEKSHAFGMRLLQQFAAL